ncbi:FAD-binding and (Fe-S)-binding domain-containing protein [Brevibacterium yomogidense]|uniref:FAD-binding and (Fe-S)-binding domain-containing protein n=1 Tax=Brevibacterium yomogidense TaxID=946573 RepID=UPI0018DF4121|nr:FAD-binding and (Fe-S)-binding domain-containing protein [Brevibacterium yomogidense]
MTSPAQSTVHHGPPGPLPVQFDGMPTVTHRATARDSTQTVKKLADELRQRTNAEVRFDDGSRAAYSTDGSNYRQVPLGVLLPRSLDDVTEAVELCRRHDVPITTRGGGTSLAGQTTNVAVIIDLSKYLDEVESIDPEEKTAWVQPGCNLDRLRHEASEFGLTYGPDPSTHSRNTLGGMIGNNSCGTHSLMSEFYGPGALTADQVLELDVLTYRGHRFTVGSMTAEELQAAIEEGGERGRILSDLRHLRDEHIARLRTGFPQIQRRVSGFNLNRLLPEYGFDVAKALVGTEGTCVTILRAKVQLIDARPERVLVAAGFEDAPRAGDAVPMVREHRPVACEGIDDKLMTFMRKKGMHPDDIDILPEGGGFLLVEFGAQDKDDARRQAETFVKACQDEDAVLSTKIVEEDWEAAKLWQIREAGLGATSHVPGMRETHPGWEDAAVPVEQVGDYLRDFRELLDEFDYEASLYGHFGQGCIHCRITFILDTAEGLQQWREFLTKAAHLVTRHGGSLSGEHGDGQARAALLDIMYGEDLVDAFAEFKHIWDPDWRLNPGKAVRPYTPTDNLKMGPDARLTPVTTHFAFPDDDGDFGKAVSRCVGVGECRNTDTGYMCPSYMATREEEDSTRGRARMLFEMLRGSDLKLWRDDHVHEALDLCLSCKSCKSECPVNVDMATYKAEYQAHYYKGRLRPRNEYTVTLIYWWARIASRLPRTVNAFTQAPLVSSLIKLGGGIAQQREIPQFRKPFTRTTAARRTSAQSSAASSPASAPEYISTRARRRTHDGSPLLDHGKSHMAEAGYSTPHMQKHGHPTTNHPHGAKAPLQVDRVVLWPDTFNNYLDSANLEATVAVLEDAGYEVSLPPRPLCCGRPLYDAGMLTLAKKMWTQILDTLRADIRAGVPVVGVEPSCVAAFRDELVGLMPNDEDATRLAQQTYLVSEFLERQNYQPPMIPEFDGTKALVQMHCHHRAVLGTDADRALLTRLGFDLEILDGGCCGLAGSFGFKAGEKYDVSVRAAERAIMPRIRAADDDTVIVADGFSCTQQIQHLSTREPQHIIQLLHHAVQQSEHAAVLTR